MILGWLCNSPSRRWKKEEFLLVCDVAKEAIRYLADGNSQERTQLVRIKLNYATALRPQARQSLQASSAVDPVGEAVGAGEGERSGHGQEPAAANRTAGVRVKKLT